MMRRILIGIVVALALALTAIAQDAPKPEAPPAKVEPGQPIPDDARRALFDLVSQISGYSRSIAVLQEKVDATVAEYNRTVAKLQAAAPPGTELSPALTYVKKKK